MQGEAALAQQRSDRLLKQKDLQLLKVVHEQQLWADALRMVGGGFRGMRMNGGKEG